MLFYRIICFYICICSYAFLCVGCAFAYGLCLSIGSKAGSQRRHSKRGSMGGCILGCSEWSVLVGQK